MPQRWFCTLLLFLGINTILAFEYRHSKQSHDVARGSSFEVNCEVNGFVKEMLLRHVVSENPRISYEILVDNTKLFQKLRSFTLTNTNFFDNGIYECVGVGDDDSIKTHVIADVKIEPEPPKLLHMGTQDYKVKYNAEQTIRGSKPFIIFDFKSPVRAFIDDTTEIRLPLKLKGLRPITIKWMKDNKQITPSKQFKISDDGQKLTFNSPVDPELSGSYEVRACNSEGCTLRGTQVLLYGGRSHPVESKVNQTKATLLTGKPVIRAAPVINNKWSYIGLAACGVAAIFATFAILLILRKKALILKRTKQILKEETKKTKKQLDRGRKTRSGSMWSWKQDHDGYTLVPYSDEASRVSRIAPPLPTRPPPRRSPQIYQPPSIAQQPSIVQHPSIAQPLPIARQPSIAQQPLPNQTKEENIHDLGNVKKIYNRFMDIRKSITGYYENVGDFLESFYDTSSTFYQSIDQVQSVDEFFDAKANASHSGESVNDRASRTPEDDQSDKFYDLDGAASMEDHFGSAENTYQTPQGTRGSSTPEDDGNAEEFYDLDGTASMEDHFGSAENTYQTPQGIRGSSTPEDGGNAEEFYDLDGTASVLDHSGDVEDTYQNVDGIQGSITPEDNEDPDVVALVEEHSGNDEGAYQNLEGIQGSITPENDERLDVVALAEEHSGNVEDTNEKVDNQ